LPSRTTLEAMLAWPMRVRKEIARLRNRAPKPRKAYDTNSGVEKSAPGSPIRGVMAVPKTKTIRGGTMMTGFVRYLATFSLTISINTIESALT